MEERRSSAPSSRNPSSSRCRASSPPPPPPVNSASSGEESRESWCEEEDARDMSMRGAGGAVSAPAAGVECERARCSPGASPPPPPAGVSRISGSRGASLLSGLDWNRERRARV